MGRYFLFYEHIKGQDQRFLPGSYDNYDAALDAAVEFPKEPQDIIYVVGTVAKVFGCAKIEKEACADISPTKCCDECGWPEHQGRCGTESITKG